MFTDYTLSVSIPSLFPLQESSTSSVIPHSSNLQIEVTKEINRYKFSKKLIDWNENCLELETLLASLHLSDVELLINISFYYETQSQGKLSAFSLVLGALTDLCSSSTFPVKSK